MTANRCTDPLQNKNWDCESSQHFTTDFGELQELIFRFQKWSSSVGQRPLPLTENNGSPSAVSCESFYYSLGYSLRIFLNQPVQKIITKSGLLQIKTFTKILHKFTYHHTTPFIAQTDAKTPV